MGQNKMSGWRWVSGSRQLPSLEGQPLHGNLCWKCSLGDPMGGMPSAPGAELSPVSHLPSRSCSFGLFSQWLVH